MADYQKSQWQAFRQEIIELDGGQCRHCGRADPEVILQVHHKKYIAGKAPWQYPYQDCETLCKGCHAAEHGIIAPKSGWRYLGYEDLGEVAGLCELCGSHYRYQFYVYHKSWGMMQVGTYCCDALTSTELASTQLSEQKKYHERRLRFMRSKRWMKISGRHILRQQGIRIEIAENDGKYNIQLDRYPGERSFETLKAAKAHVFDIIEDGSAKEFLGRRGETNPLRPDRQSVRLKNYDYSQAGLYFVTICTWQRQCVFGYVDGIDMKLNELGRLIDSELKSLVDHYPSIQLHNHVVMPNHFHGVIELCEVAGSMNRTPTLGEIVRGFKARCTREINSRSLMQQNKLWQRNYYEHIIRDEKSYFEIAQYIENNPAKWQDDIYHSVP